MLFTLQINPHGGHQAIARKELAVDHQHQQILGHGPLHQFVQFSNRSSFPMATDTRLLYPVTLQTAVNGSFIVAHRALAAQLSGHRLLQLALTLKSLIAGQLDLLLIGTAQSRALQANLAPSKDSETALMSMPPHRLPAPATELLLDLCFHDPLDDGQTQLGGEGLHISGSWKQRRSEEHTSELQSRPHLVCRLLLEKKKQ